MAQEATSPTNPPRRPRLSPGRRAGLLVVGLLAIALAATCTVQIVLAVWFPDRSIQGISCRPAVLDLVAAVDRARERAAADPQGERAALQVFRQSLEPEWARLGSVRAACRNDDDALRALRTVELLRYAEERAVRYEALDLASLRQRTLTLQRELGQSYPSRPPSTDGT